MYEVYDRKTRNSFRFADTQDELIEFVARRIAEPNVLDLVIGYEDDRTGEYHLVLDGPELLESVRARHRTQLMGEVTPAVRAGEAEIESGGEAPTGSSFVLSRTGAGKYHFVLKAGNGEILATSQSYTTKAAAKNGIDEVKENVKTAPVVDQTHG